MWRFVHWTNFSQKCFVRWTIFCKICFARKTFFLPYTIDRKYTIEVGGKGKDGKQVANQQNAYIAADNIEYPVGNKIPLWAFGFLYWESAFIENVFCNMF